ncbi:MAG: hypothetical protein LBS92_06950 [Candidatus Methanoplasma sp.]|jgi:hypothetical protein|nr:hypothetical protein [Candidatus Methanoplasma sp.]
MLKTQAQLSRSRYKHREAAGQGLRTGKGVLGMDRAYMHDDGTRGRLFVTFLALRIRTEMAMRIQDAGHSSKRSPEDVLRPPDADLDCEVGADVVRLDKGLGLNLYR